MVLRRLHRRRPAPAPTAREAGPRVDLGGATDPGPRSENQDRWAVGAGWAVVCDGVGGHAGGDRAATLAVEAAVAVLDGSAGDGDARGAAGADERVTAAVLAADAAVRGQQGADPALAHMATTVTLAVRVGRGAGDSRWVVGHVGDSPALLVAGAGGSARPVTVDHNLAGELLAAGALTPAQARTHPGRRAVTRALGVGPRPAFPDLDVVELGPGDALVLATDGLTDVLAPDAVAAVVRATPGGAAARAAALVAAAVAAGTGDNVTVAVVGHGACCPGGQPA